MKAGRTRDRIPDSIPHPSYSHYFALGGLPRFPVPEPAFVTVFLAFLEAGLTVFLTAAFASPAALGLRPRFAGVLAAAVFWAFGAAIFLASGFFTVFLAPTGFLSARVFLTAGFLTAGFSAALAGTFLSAASLAEAAGFSAVFALAEILLLITAWAAARRARGTRKGEHDT